MQKHLFFFVLSFTVFLSFGQQKNNEQSHADLFLSFFSADKKTINKNLKTIEKEWVESDEILAIESLYLIPDNLLGLKIIDLLSNKTGKNYGLDFTKWYSYIWNKPKAVPEDYFYFKATLYKTIDNRFHTYFFNRKHQSNIRLDEVRWGGVYQDGIPPLRNPKMIEGNTVSYLEDDNVVFGVEINGDVRAYPKRILAWHEMFTDVIGGVPVAGVYCTLCGTVILYKTKHKDVEYQIGTSGFLYRSNKMMYDKKTQSLWSTHSGKPVIGPLVNKGIELDYLSIVTTDWKTWKENHPETKVLSLETGYRRNYNEGVAYKNYFSTDKLMFNVPKIDKTLKNKDEVLVVRSENEKNKIIGIASKYLKKHKFYKGVINNKNFVVFTDKSGGHRAFFTENIVFLNYDKKQKATDAKGNVWIVKENTLLNTVDNTKLKRLHTYNAFWFGLKAAFPNIELIH